MPGKLSLARPVLQLAATPLSLVGQPPKAAAEGLLLTARIKRQMDPAAPAKALVPVEAGKAQPARPKPPSLD